MSEVRRLVESTLWKEDVLLHGHSRVWGSWWDPETQRWGYACCQGFDRSAACPKAAASSAGAAAAVSESDEANDSDATDSEEAQRHAEGKKIDWRDGPPELLPREKVETGDENHEAFVVHFVRFWMRTWRRVVDEADTAALAVEFGVKGDDLQAFREAQSLEQVEEAMDPLVRQQRKGLVKPVVLQQLDKIVSLAVERRYADANKAYMEMVLGNKKWNNCLASYGGASGTNKGCRIYITKQDDLLEYDKDPAVQKYVQAMRRLIYFAQCIRPNEDSSQTLVM